MNYVVGLTGGIGSGKSTVAGLFAELGAAVVDTDVIAHALTGPHGAAMPEIVSAFGRECCLPDGSLDRNAMRRRCFADPGARQRLESILHPRIRAESDRCCARANDAPYVLLVVPLLVETGFYRTRIHRLLVVDCDEAQQLARVRARNGLADEEILRIMASQASRAERLAVADDVVVNTGALASIEVQIQGLHLRYLALARELKENH